MFSFSDVSQAGLRVDGGAGNRIQSTSIKVAGDFVKALELGPQTSDGEVGSSSFEGIVSIKGNGNTLRSLSSKGAVNILGCGNKLTSSSFQKLYVTSSCQNNVGGFTNSIRERLQSPVGE
jgi:hypothetical protein